MPTRDRTDRLTVTPSARGTRTGDGRAPGRGRARARGGGRGRRVAVRLLVVLTVLGLVAAGGWAWWQGSVGGVALREHCTAVAQGRSTELTPEQTGNAATITAIAVRRGLPPRAATIGIATAIQESKLVNIDYGDRDSLGLFQQRPSQGWGSTTQVRDPVYASNAFYDALVKVDGYEDLPITQAAQKVQRSAYPTAYAAHEPEARILASSLTGFSAGGLTCVLRSPGALPAQGPGRDGLTARARAVQKAAAAEAGRAGTRTAGDATGRSVAFALTGRSASEHGWALAHWAVARADALHVVSVQTAGRQWRRDRPDAGWIAAPDGAPQAGRVVVTVAAGG